MSRAAALILAFALFFGPFGLGLEFAWADHHGKPGSQHGIGGEHPYPECLVVCGGATCAPVVTSSGSGIPIDLRGVKRLVWTFVNDRALYFAPGKQDPPVPRFRA